MENLSNIIANKIALELNMDNDRREVIAYGIFALLQTFLLFLLVSVIGYFFHVSIEGIIVVITVGILRKYSGGAHATTPGNCNLVGVIIGIGLPLFISAMVNEWIGFYASSIIVFVSFIWSLYIIYKLAPVDSISKPIKKEEKKTRMKKGSLLILSFYFIIVISLLALYFNFEKALFLIFALCITGGTAWQSFTLTRMGHLTVSKIDAFLRYIIK